MEKCKCCECRRCAYYYGECKREEIQKDIKSVSYRFDIGGYLRKITLQTFKLGELVIFTSLRDSFIIEAEGKKLRVSYDEFHGNHEDAMRFCKKHNGGDETIENIHIISKYRNEINKELKAFGKNTIEGWYWTNKILWAHNNCAFITHADGGYVSNDSCDRSHYARAIKDMRKE